MINKKILLSGIALVSALSACTLKASEPVPAILPDNTSDVRTEIVNIVSEALGGKKVPIASDVFQESSRLLLSTKPVVSPNGVTVYGTNQAPALVFELIKQGDDCLLRRLDTMQTWPLSTKLCIKR
jgi:hypothetical protein